MQMEIMNFLREHSPTFSMTARQFHTSPTKIIKTFDTFGQMKRLPFDEVVCFDEFYGNRKSSTKYACMIISFDTGNSIDIIHGRKLKDWTSYTQVIDKDELKKVKYICIDLFETYRQVQKIYFPKAILCADKFMLLKMYKKFLEEKE
jgi:transposase